MATSDISQKLIYILREPSVSPTFLQLKQCIVNSLEVQQTQLEKQSLSSLDKFQQQQLDQSKFRLNNIMQQFLSEQCLSNLFADVISNMFLSSINKPEFISKLQQDSLKLITENQSLQQQNCKLQEAFNINQQTIKNLELHVTQLQQKESEFKTQIEQLNNKTYLLQDQTDKLCQSQSLECSQRLQFQNLLQQSNTENKDLQLSVRSHQKAEQLLESRSKVLESNNKDLQSEMKAQNQKIVQQQLSFSQQIQEKDSMIKMLTQVTKDKFQMLALQQDEEKNQNYTSTKKILQDLTEASDQFMKLQIHENQFQQVLKQKLSELQQSKYSFLNYTQISSMKEQGLQVSCSLLQLFQYVTSLEQLFQQSRIAKMIEINNNQQQTLKNTIKIQDDSIQQAKIKHQDEEIKNYQSYKQQIFLHDQNYEKTVADVNEQNEKLKNEIRILKQNQQNLRTVKENQLHEIKNNLQKIRLEMQKVKQSVKIQQKNDEIKEIKNNLTDLVRIYQQNNQFKDSELDDMQKQISVLSENSFIFTNNQSFIHFYSRQHLAFNDKYMHHQKYTQVIANILSQLKQCNQLYLGFVDEISQCYNEIISFICKQKSQSLNLPTGCPSIVYMNYIRSNFNTAMELYIQQQMEQVYNNRIKRIFKLYDKQQNKEYLTIVFVLSLIAIDGYEIIELQRSIQSPNRNRFRIFPAFQKGDTVLQPLYSEAK